METISEHLYGLLDTVRALRGDQGCPWDRRQSPQTIRKHLLAECEELVLAIDNADPENTCEELGDLLYIIIMLAEIHADRGDFVLAEVIAGINTKLIRRHPHVFAGQSYSSESELAEQWQAIKAQEKKKNSN